MAVIAVENDEDIFGLSAWLGRSIIRYAIEQAGDKPYLRDFNNAFEWGYNSISVYELSTSDLVEFADLLREYASCFELNADGYDEDAFRHHVTTLSERVDRYLEKRLLN